MCINKFLDNWSRPPFIIPKEKIEINFTSLFITSLWGLSTGMIVAQALDSRVSWVNHATILLPFIKGENFPSRFYKKFNYEPLSLDKKITRIVASIIFFGIGYSLIISLNRSMPFLKEEESYSFKTQICILAMQGILTTIDSLFYEKLNQKKQKQISAKALAIEHQTLLERTERLKKSNLEKEKCIQEIRNYIYENEILRSAFVTCYKQTEYILLPPSKDDDFPPLDDLIFEENRKEAKKRLELNWSKKRIEHFLENNPSFNNLLQQSLNKDNQIALINFLNCS
jgi:hypothetical protein